MKKFFKSIFRFIRDYAFGLFTIGLVLWYFFGSKFGPQFPIQDFLRNNSYESQNLMQKSFKSSRARIAYDEAKIMQDKVDGFAGNIPASQRKQVKNGSLTLEVENSEEARTLVEEEVVKLEGFITNLNSWETRPKALSYNMTIKVPAESLETLIANLANIGHKKYENFSVNDITAVYEDSENRLENLRSRRNRLRKMMEEKTDNLNNILQIDRELANVQTQIENLVASQKRRDTNIAYATLQLTLSPATEIEEFQSSEWDITKTLKNSINDLIKDSRRIIEKLVRLAVYTPIWLPALLILWSLKVFLFGKRKK